MGSKWEKDATATENILALYTLLLFNNTYYSLTNLSKNFNVSKATMLRYIQQLERAKFGNIQVEKRGREDFYRLNRLKELPKITLSVEGLQQLALCRDFMHHLFPASMQQNIDVFLQQSTAYLPQNATNSTNTTNTIEEMGLHCKGRAFTKGQVDYTPFQETLKILMQAIRDNAICTISYKARRSAPESTFDYAPKELISFKEAIHIAGWKVTDKGPVECIKDHSTDLALHRITKVELTKRSSSAIPAIKEKHEGAFGYMEDELFEAVIKFHSDAATYVAERIWSPDQTIIDHEDGAITLIFNVRSVYEFRSWILGFGADAEVISPDWVREELLEIAENVYEIYDE